MNIKILKSTLLSLAAMASAVTINAQEKKSEKDSGQYHSYDIIKNDGAGKLKESVQSLDDGKEYRFDIVNDKVTNLHVDGVMVPADKYAQYDPVVGRIRKQIKIDQVQARKDQVQARLDQKRALKDQNQARLDQAQARRDQANASIDREQAEKNEVQAKLSEDLARKDQANARLDKEQAEKDEAQAKLEQDQAMKEQANAKLDQEQAEKEQVQAKLDQEQAEKDQLQAKIDQKQAEEDQRLMKSMISDLIKDGIIPDEKSLTSVTLNSTELTVNDKKQPDAVFGRYKEKYNRFATGNFSYSNNQNGYHGIHMNRHTK